jgi:Tc5 transposase DNA-binding domain
VRAYGVPPSTFHDRMGGKQPRRIAYEHEQRLTPIQVDFLTNWVLEQDLQGFAPPHTRLREMAARIIDQNYDTKLLGKSWVSAYLQRNPRIKSSVGRPIEAARAEGAQPEQIQEFYPMRR